jgi:hypothetical protein
MNDIDRMPPATGNAASSMFQQAQPLADRARPILRRARSMTLRTDGGVDEARFMIPVLPLFEGAFTAFARGALVETVQGPVAIEDLLPGDSVRTVSGEAMPVLWIGSTTVSARHDLPTERPITLHRIAADAFGPNRPMTYLVTGPAARLRQATPRLGAHGQRVLCPVAVFEDGIGVSRTTPPSAIDLFHFALPRHAVIRVSGIETESYHPGLGTIGAVGPAMRDLFLKLFPHITGPADFGPLACPQMDPDLGQGGDWNAA